MGGLRAILSRRVEDLDGLLSDDEQRVAMQVLLRMVRLGHGTGDVCRRVTMTELTDLEIDAVALSAVLDQFGHHRLVSSDRDPISRLPTVEWLTRRCSASGIVCGVDRTPPHALGRLESFRAAVEEWESSGHDPDYLIAGVASPSSTTGGAAASS